MYLFIMFFLMLGAYGTEWMSPIQPNSYVNYQENASDIYANGMIVYHQAAQKYYVAHPSFVGIIPIENLDLPIGYNMLNMWEARVVAGGWVIVVAVNIPHQIAPASLARSVQIAKSNSAGSGLMSGGLLVSSRFSPLILPIAIPDGTVAIATMGG